MLVKRSYAASAIERASRWVSSSAPHLGIYQGRAIDLAFWHPSSGMPEQGLCRFSTREKAQALIDVLCSSACLEPMARQELTIEPYDVDEHERLSTEYPLPSAWETPL